MCQNMPGGMSIFRAWNDKVTCHLLVLTEQQLVHCDPDVWQVVWSLWWLSDIIEMFTTIDNFCPYKFFLLQGGQACQVLHGDQ